MKKLTQDERVAIEQQHNVCVDVDTMSYNTDSHDADYEWIPIPQQWIDNVREEGETERGGNFEDAQDEDV